eukprot:scaffold41463_cov75-Phaeocystis_antarctica.AAC.3
MLANRFLGWSGWAWAGLRYCFGCRRIPVDSLRYVPAERSKSVKFSVVLSRSHVVTSQLRVVSTAHVNYEETLRSVRRFVNRSHISTVYLARLQQQQLELLCAAGWLRQHLHARLVTVVALLATLASGGGAARPAERRCGHDEHIGLRRGRAPRAVHLHPPPLVAV